VFVDYDRKILVIFQLQLTDLSLRCRGRHYSVQLRRVLLQTGWAYIINNWCELIHIHISLAMTFWWRKFRRAGGWHLRRWSTVFIGGREMRDVAQMWMVRRRVEISCRSRQAGHTAVRSTQHL